MPKAVYEPIGHAMLDVCSGHGTKDADAESGEEGAHVVVMGLVYNGGEGPHQPYETYCSPYTNFGLFFFVATDPDTDHNKCECTNNIFSPTTQVG
mmetsp:Transcript_40274/g.65282  ORF Transcript_40274/g.65282 Transcript_40274/m.65282 type:complete len:95 (+) Transcript_40274:652-936(+)